MKKVGYLFGIASMALAVSHNIANASEFSDKFYGHAKLGASVSLQSNKFGGYDLWFKKDRARVNVEFSYNVYYKLNDFIDPFIGVNFRGKIPTGDNAIKDYSNDNIIKVTGNEYFSASVNLGAKMKINKAISIAPYGLAGLTIDKVEYKNKYYPVYPIGDTNVGFTTGGGVEVILFDRFSIGAEYRYGETKFKGYFDGAKIKKQEGVIKFGVYFL